MITLIELLEDPVYRAFFTTVPKTLVPPQGRKPWQVLTRTTSTGPWAKQEFAKYAEAFRFLAPQIKQGAVHDAAIRSLSIAFAPPERRAKVSKGGKPVMVKSTTGLLVHKTVTVRWKPRFPIDEFENHIWCTYCRRPTVFRWFKTHHAIRGTVLDGLTDPTYKLCTICGSREEFIRSTQANAQRPGFDPSKIAASGRRSRR